MLLYCSEILASRDKTPGGARVDPKVREVARANLIFEARMIFFLRTRVVGRLSNPPCSVLNKQKKRRRFSCWCIINITLKAAVVIQTAHVCDGEVLIPVANLFLLRESLYPVPSSSMSTPDRVLPSFINCTARVEGVDGPSDSSNLALRHPEPAVKHKQINSLPNDWTSSFPHQTHSVRLRLR